MRYGQAAVGDGISYLLQAGAVFVLHSMTSLTLGRIFLCIGGTSLMGAAVQYFQVRPRFAKGSPSIGINVFWNLGKWAAATKIVSLANGQLLAWALGVFRGVSSVAGFQVVANIFGVTHPVMFGIGNVIVPSVAKARARGGNEGSWRTARKYGLQGACFIVPYLAFTALVPRGMLTLFYGKGSPYLSLGGSVRLMSAAYLLMYLGQVTGGMLNGLGLANRTFWSGTAAAVAAVVVGIPLLMVAGLSGAVGGCLLAAAVVLAMNAAFIRQARTVGVL
jgi:O-antigen/teichoic acid export membrane protein